ncbi:tetratricopeptide repeat protein [Aliivibrio wodanis]|uniref:tetratricopeptide repeat protein n=1 Tax=Aliivibrio wodanis TaxID=80852 RepID=UPI00406C9E3A
MNLKLILKVLIPVLLFLFYIEFAHAGEIVVGDTSWQEFSIEQKEQYLSESSQNTNLPISQRVSATVELGRFSGANAIIAVGRASRSSEAELRIAAVQAAEQWQGRAKWDVVSPLLDDHSELVRSAAVRALMPIWNILPEAYQHYLEQSVDIYLQDLPETLEADLERSWFYSAQNDFLKSKNMYQQLNQQYSDPRISLGYVQVLSNHQEYEEANRILLEHLTTFPKNANLHYRLAFTYHQLGLNELSSSHFFMAYDNAPNNAKMGYAYAISIRKTESNKAIEVLTKVYNIEPDPSYLYAKCDTLLMAKKDASTCLSLLKTVTHEHVVTELMQRY